jgi:mono/diheme cytochrome c family protein
MRARTVVAAVLLTILAPLARSFAGEPRPPDNPLQGRLLFESRNCLKCHGITADAPGIGPDLGQGAFRGSFLDLGAALWNHVPAMSLEVERAKLSWPELAPKEAVDLLSFLYFIDYLGQPGDATAGQRVFRREGCVSCHAVNGKGGSLGPDLGKLQRFASPLVVAQQIWNHGPRMLANIRRRGMAPPSFAPGDLADLSAYLRQRSDPTPKPGVLLAPGNPNHGRVVFDAEGCSSCHGEDARGGEGPDLARSSLPRSAEALAGTMWNHALQMHGLMVERGIGWPTFTTEDLADLLAFVYFLPFSDPPGNPARGAAVFEERSCSSCHAPDVKGEHAGPDLFHSAAVRSPETLVAAMWSHAPFMAEAILAEGRPWPELDGQQLRDLLAFLKEKSTEQ